MKLNFKKIKKILTIDLFKTLLFNFYYFPLRQAVKLPVFLYNTNLLFLGGKVSIESTKIRPGMIQLGFCAVPIFNKAKFVWRCKGHVVFKSNAFIGNNSAICCYPKAKLIFGANFVASNNIKIECFKFVEFGDNTQFAWECIVMDSSQHRVKNEQGEFIGEDFSKIQTGKNCWFGSRCMLLKGAKIPDYCIVAAGSIITKDYSKFPEKSLIASDNKIVVKRTGIWREPEDPHDQIATELWRSE